MTSVCTVQGTTSVSFIDELNLWLDIAVMWRYFCIHACRCEKENWEKRG